MKSKLSTDTDTNPLLKIDQLWERSLYEVVRDPNASWDGVICMRVGNRILILHAPENIVGWVVGMSLSYSGLFTDTTFRLYNGSVNLSN